MQMHTLHQGRKTNDKGQRGLEVQLETIRQSIEEAQHVISKVARLELAFQSQENEMVALKTHIAEMEAKLAQVQPLTYRATPDGLKPVEDVA